MATALLSPRRADRGRIAAAFLLALAIALSAYVLIDATRAHRMAFASLWFLAVLPGFLSAFICYVGDPARSRPATFYWAVPVLLTGLVVVGSAALLHEGLICLIMLAPVWIVSGWIGAFALRVARRRATDGAGLHCSVLLLAVTAGIIENQVPFPHEPVDLTRSVLIHAAPEDIWPFTLATAHIAPGEGRWTVAQNIVRIPRPSATRLAGTGIGAVRTAYWGDTIHFDEIITDWQPSRRLAWRFSFTNSSVQDSIDQHLSPDGQFLHVESGAYTLQRLGPALTRLTLQTRYIAKTHVNAYAKLWGELLLGDVEDDILAIICQRAEAASTARPD